MCVRMRMPCEAHLSVEQYELDKAARIQREALRCATYLINNIYLMSCITVACVVARAPNKSCADLLGSILINSHMQNSLNRDPEEIKEDSVQHEYASPEKIAAMSTALYNTLRKKKKKKPPPEVNLLKSCTSLTYVLFVQAGVRFDGRVATRLLTS